MFRKLSTDQIVQSNLGRLYLRINDEKKNTFLTTTTVLDNMNKKLEKKMYILNNTLRTLNYILIHWFYNKR